MSSRACRRPTHDLPVARNAGALRHVVATSTDVIVLERTLACGLGSCCDDASFRENSRAELYVSILQYGSIGLVRPT
jgi:hypothetical protein